MLMCAACSTLTSIPKLYRVKMMITAPTFPLTFTNNPLSFTSSMTKLNYPLHVHLSSLIFQSSLPRKSHLGLISCSQSSITRRSKGSFDPELRLVLELATDSELYELERILFGPSYFSPLLKSVTSRADVDYVMIGEDYEEREYFFELLESRFVYLAADARSTLRGWRPSYREILLSVRRKLGVPCSSKLSTEDLEVEIFLHLLQEYSRETDDILHTWEDSEINNSSGGVELGLNQQKVQTSAAMRIGAAELKSMILKAGGVFTLGKIYQVVARRLSGKMLLEAANYQIKNEIIKEGGKLAALSLEPRAALFAAKKGLAGAASRFLGLRSMMMLLGPMLWGTFLADVVIQMLGTDYARILRAIYAFAQIRITRTYKLASQKDQLL